MQQIMRLSPCICMHLPSWSISCICMHLPSWSISCICMHLPSWSISCICMHLPSWSVSCICMHLPSWSVSCIRCQHRLSVRTVCIKILHFTFGFHIFDRCLMYFSAEMYSAWMRRAAGSRSPSLLLTTTKSDTSTMPRLIPARTTCTDNSHPVLKATLTHVLIHSAPLDPCTDNMHRQQSSCP